MNEIISYMKNKKYSVKEAIAYYKITFEEINKIKRKISLDEFETYLKCNLILHQLDVVIFDYANCEHLSLCKFYWEINQKEIFAFGDMLYLKLYLNNEIVTEKDIINELNILMRFYSPQNAVQAIQDLKENLSKLGD